MKQLRLLLLMLVACVAQASHGQDLTKKWAEAAELEKNVTTALLYAQDDNDAASRINSIIEARYMTYDESIGHVRGYIKKIKGKLPKWDEKISKGKKIDYDDALKAAVCYSSSYAKLQDYSKAAKYFEAAAEGAEDNTLKAVLRLSAVGCKYQADKDKAAAAAAINFDIPAGSESAMICIARKYGMQDIASEKLQQVFNVSQRQITRAIRSNNIEELKKYEVYDIPEVDSVLALKEGTNDLYWKCLMKHKMLWPLKKLDFSVVMSRTDLPTNVFKCAFLIPLEKEYGWKYKMLDYVLEDLQNTNDRVGSKAEKTFRYLNYLKRRNDIAPLSLSIVLQVYGQTVDSFNRDFVFDLQEYTAQLLGNNEAEKSKTIESINKSFNDYFSINTNGMVKLNPQFTEDNNYRKKIVDVYEKMAAWILNSDLLDYKPAEKPNDMYGLNELINIIYQNTAVVVLDNGLPLNALLTVDVDGSITSMDIIIKDENGKISSCRNVPNVKVEAKCKPAMRGGQPFKDILEIKFNQH